MLFGDDERKLQRIVSEFGMVCERRNLKVNVEKSKVMVFERGTDTDCDIRLNGCGMENVRTFKYLGSLLSKDSSMDGELGERV